MKTALAAFLLLTAGAAQAAEPMACCKDGCKCCEAMKPGEGHDGHKKGGPAEEGHEGHKGQDASPAPDGKAQPEG